jgi:Domain of unknown function (DUF4382)
MNVRRSWMIAMLAACAFLSFTRCDDDDNNNTATEKGQVQFEITDAPSDDANIKSVFVTIADIKVDGQSVSGFSKQTVDLKAYQKGNTKVLGISELDAQSYNTITLVLDLDNSSDGSGPGSYVLTEDNTKHKLGNSAASSGRMEILLNKNWTVQTGTTSALVMDFDLRKSLAYTANSTSAKYSFASPANMQSAIRVVAKENTGTVRGTYTEQVASNADLVVVYAYKKGGFNASEAQPQNDVPFKNAVASAKVDIALAGNTYVLPFMESGEYELYFVSYGKDALSDRFIYRSLLQSDTMVNGSVTTTITVQAKSEVSVSAIIKGILNTTQG